MSDLMVGSSDTLDALTALAPYFGAVVSLLAGGLTTWMTVRNRRRHELDATELAQRKLDLDATGQLRDRLLGENARLEQRVAHLEEINTAQTVRLQRQETRIFDLVREVAELREVLQRPTDGAGRPVERRQAGETP